MELICNNLPYKLEIGERDISRIKNAEIILLQITDGLKQFSLTLKNCIENIVPYSKVIIDSSKVFGGCDLHLETFYTLKPDVVIHIGHNLYPLVLADNSKEIQELIDRTIFIPAYSLLEIDKSLMYDLVKNLQNLNAKKVSIVATVQHVNIIDEIANELRNEGFIPVIPFPFHPVMVKGQVLGCEYSAIKRVDKHVDAHIIVSGGRFHYLGALLSASKPVIQLDLYSRKVVLDLDVKKSLLSRRYYKIMKSMDANHYGIIIGSKTGQYRPWLVRALETIIRKRSKMFTEFVAETLSKEILLNIDNSSIDAYIVTSCPRLPIDDLYDFHKPVLTPGEAFMILSKNIDKYIFPW